MLTHFSYSSLYLLEMILKMLRPNTRQQHTNTHTHAWKISDGLIVLICGFFLSSSSSSSTIFWFFCVVFSNSSILYNNYVNFFVFLLIISFFNDTNLGGKMKELPKST